MNTNKTFKSLTLIGYTLFSDAVLAQVDQNSESYRAGHSAGKLFGYVIIGIVIYAVIRKFTKKWRSQI